MRIIDWSSDLCSSDLVGSPLPEPVRRETLLMRPGVRRRGGPSCVFYSVRHGVPKRRQKKVQVGLARARRTPSTRRAEPAQRIPPNAGWSPTLPDRSEEHTSELTSLKRISYAVF